MTPVILLTDGYIANASELWPLPDLETYPDIETRRPTTEDSGSVFQRNPATLARLWAAPGDERFVHRIGGIEKDIDSGNISYDAANHQSMTNLRTGKIASVADFIDPQTIDQGHTSGLAVVAWGSTYGTIFKAVKDALIAGLNVAHIHIRHISPLPPNLAELLADFDTVLIPELNNGQLATLIRDRLCIPVQQLNKVTGQPLTVTEVRAAIELYATRQQQSAG